MSSPKAQGPSRGTVGGDTDVEVELGTEQGCYPVPIAIGWLEKRGYGRLLRYPLPRCEPIGPEAPDHDGQRPLLGG
jgi:hypothetical protein